MKEMVYGGPVETLHEGTYNGYNYVIGSFGSHPVAYVEIPESHPYYKKPYGKIPIDCHGGLTYGEAQLHNFGKQSGCWNGWDYAHWGDYIAMRDGTVENGKRWTTAEILKEVYDVIEQLRELEKPKEELTDV